MTGGRIEFQRNRHGDYREANRRTMAAPLGALEFGHSKSYSGHG